MTISNQYPFDDQNFAERLEEAAESRFPQSHVSQNDGDGGSEPGGESATPPGSAIEQEQQEQQLGQQEQAPPPQQEQREPVQVEIDGRVISEPELRAWAQLDDLFRSDPGLAQTVYGYLRGGSQPPATPPGQERGVGSPTFPPPSPAGAVPPTAPTVPPSGAEFPPTISQPGTVQGGPGAQLPEGVDLSDPTTAYLWQTIQHQNNLIRNFHGEISRLQEITHSRVRADTTEIVSSVSQQFKDQFGIDDQTFDRIRGVAARLEVIPAILERGIDPITGQPTDPNPVNALNRALEVAAWSIPEVRTHIVNQQMLQMQEDSRRKQRLNSIGGASRSAPRQAAPMPQNIDEAKRQAVAEVRAAMFNGTTEE